jgi:hypothetical protein
MEGSKTRCGGGLVPRRRRHHPHSPRTSLWRCSGCGARRVTAAALQLHHSSAMGLTLTHSLSRTSLSIQPCMVEARCTHLLCKVRRARGIQLQDSVRTTMSCGSAMALRASTLPCSVPVSVRGANDRAGCMDVNQRSLAALCVLMVRFKSAVIEVTMTVRERRQRSCAR